MNKTIIININGTVFHIEENAYEILKQYMTAVKMYFFNSEDSLEITTDIENRIAELFTEILQKESRQVVIEPDVNFVIQQMGAVEDFENSAADTDAHAFVYRDKIQTRRLFRDPDDHLVSGVCAGIANYFDIPPVWVRLAFAITTLFAGTGLFLYVILWLVIPKAITRSDKMSMKGEKLDLEGFKKNFEAELGNVRTSLAAVQLETQPFIYRFRDFITEFVNFIGRFLGKSGKLILKTIGLLFLITFFLGAVTLLIALIVLLVSREDLNYIFPFSIIGNQFGDWIYVSAFALIIIPLFALIALTSKVVFNTQRLGRATAFTLLIVWICALTLLIYLGSKVSSGFKWSASFDQTVKINSTPNNVYYLKLSNTKFFTGADSAKLNIQSRFHGLIVTDEGDNNEPQNVRINIEKSDVSQPVLIARYKAKGKSYEKALYNARNTQYNFLQKDSVLTFDYQLHRLTNEPWHAEEIELTLKVPVNSKLIIDRNIQKYTSVNFYDCVNDNKTPDADKAPFIMTATGLQCKIDTLAKDSIITAPNVKKH